MFIICELFYIFAIRESPNPSEGTTLWYHEKNYTKKTYCTYRSNVSIIRLQKG